MNFTKTTTVLGLIAGSAMALAAIPAQAASLFGDGGIKFDKTTTVDFWFMESNGKFKSTLSVVKAADKNNPLAILFSEAAPGYDVPKTDDFHGTCPKTVTSPTGKCHNWFTFKKDVEYSLLLDSGLKNPNLPDDSDGKVWSTDELNDPDSNQAWFTPMGDYTYQIAFDDKGAGPDQDFQDFIVKAEIKHVPEPAALAGLGLVAGTMTLIRRRQKQ
ncbi:MAG TPA: hypothetical protein DDW51_00560 [Cyanobacteria bacterium UBA11367]|nr:hypothetical protein [Cyanobacteria bacterium UBA11367]HBE60292.1 hypothetical protein [Cyanobacteria bacterium UBA11366]HBK64052.1 hypothetical protein [Cyanobacteria bacterium UBA11166]